MAKQLIETYSGLHSGLQQWVIDTLVKGMADDQVNFTNQ